MLNCSRNLDRVYTKFMAIKELGVCKLIRDPSAVGKLLAMRIQELNLTANVIDIIN